MPQLAWNQAVNPSPFVEHTEEYGPFQLPDINTGEFSFPEFIQSSVSKVSANADRIFNSTRSPLPASQAEGPAWYNIPGRISAAAAGVNDAFQSTLVKVIVLVALVGLIAVFGLSYVQAKGANFAK